MSLSSGSSSSGHSSSGGNGRAQPAGPGYYAYRHPVGYDDGGIEQVDLASSSVPRYFGEGNSTTDRKMGSVSVQNGGLNLHIPCAFSYDYDVPVPPQPAHTGKSLKASSLRTNEVCKDKRPISQPQPLNKSSKPATRPFVSTVKTGQLYKAKKVPHSQDVSRTKAKTSVVWDYHAGVKVPFQAVDYGQELYEQAAQNLAQQLQQQKLSLGNKSSVGSNSTDVEDNCFDFSKPGVNSSRYATKALERAIEDLKSLPEEVEGLLRKDKRFEPLITKRATKALNVSRNTRVYKDLIPVDPNPDVRTEAENVIQAEIKRSIEAARQPNKAKDPEPKLEDFQSNSYTRIRPAAVPTPPKPTSGISIESNHDFDTIEGEKLLEDESNRLE